MIKEPDGNLVGGQNAEELSYRQPLLKTVELDSSDDLPDETLREMVEAFEKTVYAHKPKER